MKRHLLILALCGAAQAGDFFGYERRRYEADNNDQTETEERIEAIEAQVRAINSTVTITEGVSRDVQVITQGRIIDLRR